MASYLLDTHALLWWHEDHTQLSQVAKDIISKDESRLYLSVVSLWEIVIKQNSGKLRLEYNLEELVKKTVDSNIEIVRIKLFHLNQLSLLPLIHRDPFDRLIVATAYCEEWSLISKDKVLDAYNIKVIW